MDNLNKYKKVMIAGASGMVGNAIKRAYLNKKQNYSENYKLLSPTRQELNLLNFTEVENWFKKK